MDNMNKRLKALRKSKGWTQEYMAKRLDITQSAYSQIEAGKTINMRIKTLYDLCTTFDISADYLLGFKDESNEELSNPVMQFYINAIDIICEYGEEDLIEDNIVDQLITDINEIKRQLKF